MTNPEILELIDRFEAGSTARLKLTTSAYTLELEKPGAAPAASSPAAVPATATAKPAAKASADETICAPLVGAFYAASAPDAAPFVRVGDHVRKGQTVCLLEAMKMMSEVPAPCDGVITAVLKQNGELAAFGEALFRYQPC